MKLTITSGRVFFLVNTRHEINLTHHSQVSIFDTFNSFRKKIDDFFRRVTWSVDGTCTAITDNGVLIFYYDNEEVIEKFLMVDVFLTDEPFAEVKKLSKSYNWLLYDLETENYLPL